MRYVLRVPVLIYKRADGTEISYEVGGKPLIFGRLPEAEIQVRDAFISRIHANIHFVNNAFVLKDLGSTNGTYRNGTRVYECELASGDKIQVGDAALVFEIDITTGVAILRQVPALASSPRPPAGKATAVSEPLVEFARPNDLKMTTAVPLPPRR